MKVVLIAGGLGGARLAPQLAKLLPSGSLTVVANVGDDLEWMGLRVCPDLDSVSYALAGIWDRPRGWGRVDESFFVRDALASLDAPAWFGVGDRDLALHLGRTRLLREGASLSEATRALVGRLGVAGVDVLPASDEPSGTRIALRDGRTLDFQEWYVRERAEPAVDRVMLSGSPAAPAALAALASCDVVVLAPSNPVTSIGAVLALRGIEDAVNAVPYAIAVSPVVRAKPVADRGLEHHARARRAVLGAEGVEDRPAAIAARYRGLVSAFVLDAADAADQGAVRSLGVEVRLADTLDEAALARTLADLAASERAA